MRDHSCCLSGIVQPEASLQTLAGLSPEMPAMLQVCFYASFPESPEARTYSPWLLLCGHLFARFYVLGVRCCISLLVEVMRLKF